MNSSDFVFNNGNPHILSLDGISIKDYMAPEDIADIKFLKDEISLIKEINIFAKIPSIFTSKKEWPTNTNLHCWQCNCTFDDPPAFIPNHIRETINGCIEIGVKGNMCTFNCASRYILNMSNLGEEKWRYLDNLNIVYFLFTGIHTQIKPAPEKICLKKYGGIMSDDQYWEELKKLDPAAGLKDHTPGSVVPDRERTNHILDILKNPLGISIPVKRIIDKNKGAHTLIPGKHLNINLNSMWKLCNIECNEGNNEDDNKGNIEYNDGNINKKKLLDDLLDDLLDFIN